MLFITLLFSLVLLLTYRFSSKKIQGAQTTSIFRVERGREQFRLFHFKKIRLNCTRWKDV